MGLKEFEEGRQNALRVVEGRMVDMAAWVESKGLKTELLSDTRMVIKSETLIDLGVQNVIIKFCGKYTAVLQEFTDLEVTCVFNRENTGNDVLRFYHLVSITSCSMNYGADGMAMAYGV